MDSGLRKEVTRRVWISLCECCTFVCISIINVLAATIYLKLNRVDWVEVPELLWVFAAVELVWSTFLDVLRWGSTIQTETRLRLFLFTIFLGVVWALIVVAVLRRGSCASTAVDYVQVSLKKFRHFWR
jgi:hypothetical protein